MLKFLRLLSLLYLSLSSAAYAKCTANTELEAVYCQLQAKGEALPKMSDFRRNDPQMQKLLLKRPASRHHIALPEIAKKSTSVARVTSKSKKVAPLSVVDVPAPKKILSTHKSPLAGHELQASCTISGERISCSGQHYQLLDNLNNRHLDKQVFSDSNLLGMSNYQGSFNHKSSLNSYMAGAYQRYIDGMLKIGLAASTMTYSKFYYTFEDAWHNKRDFADRFEKMYVFLKKDKQTMGVKKRYSDTLPAGLHQCAELSDSIIVCDNKKINWVYFRS